MSKPDPQHEFQGILEDAGFTPQQAGIFVQFFIQTQIESKMLELHANRIIAHIWTALGIMAFAFFYFMPA